MPRTVAFIYAIVGALLSLLGLVLTFHRGTGDRVGRFLSRTFGDEHEPSERHQRSWYLPFRARRTLTLSGTILLLLGYVLMFPALAPRIVPGVEARSSDTVRVVRPETLFVVRANRIDSLQSGPLRDLRDSVSEVLRAIEQLRNRATTRPSSSPQEPPGHPDLSIPGRTRVDTLALLRRALTSLHPGVFRVSGLDSMVARRARSVYVTMRHRLSTDSLPPNLAKLSAGAFADTVRLGHAATVCMTAPKADFVVEAVEGQCYRQPIVPGRETRWRWTVTPVDSGRRQLDLRITSIVAGSPYQFVDTSYVLTVAVAPESLLDKVTRWLKTTEGLVTTLAALVAALSGLAVTLWKLVKRDAAPKPSRPFRAWPKRK